MFVVGGRNYRGIASCGQMMRSKAGMKDFGLAS